MAESEGIKSRLLLDSAIQGEESTSTNWLTVTGRKADFFVLKMSCFVCLFFSRFISFRCCGFWRDAYCNMKNQQASVM